MIRSAAKVAAKTHGGMAKATLRFLRTHEALWHMLFNVMKVGSFSCASFLYFAAYDSGFCVRVSEHR